MILLQTKTDADVILIFFRIVGVLIGAGIFSILSGLLIKLAVKLIAEKPVKFSKAFWISFFSIIAAFIFDEILRSSADPVAALFLNVLPAIVFFVSSWFLIAQSVRLSEDENARSYLKALLAAVLQMAFLMVAGVIITLAVMLAWYLQMRSSYTHYQLSSAPKPQSGTANVVGTVVWYGKGAANIEVRLCKSSSYNLACDKYKTVTDEKGDFLFAGVEPGSYAIKTRLFDTNHFATRDKGFSVFVDSDGNSKKYNLIADQTIQVDDQFISKNDLKMVSPLGGVIKEKTPTFTVENYPGAYLYHVHIFPISSPDSPSTDFYCVAIGKNSCSPEKPLPDGTYLWNVEAAIEKGESFIEIAKSAFDKSGYGYFTVFGSPADSFVIQSKSPQAGATVSGKNLTFEWEKDARSLYYVVDVYDESFKKLSYDPTMKEPRFVFGKDVRAGKYFYEIKAFDKPAHLIGTSGLISFTVQ